MPNPCSPHTPPCPQDKATPGELFSQFDRDADGFWSDREQWAMLKELFPGLRPQEQTLLFEAFQVRARVG